jgi:hypothetical protein
MCAALLQSAPARAANPVVAPSGGDFSSAQSALDAAVAGDIVRVRESAQPYFERVRFSRSASADAGPIAREAWPDDRHRVGAAHAGTVEDRALEGRKHVRVVGFEIRNNVGVRDGSGIRIPGADRPAPPDGVAQRGAARRPVGQGEHRDHRPGLGSRSSRIAPRRRPHRRDPAPRRRRRLLGRDLHEPAAPQRRRSTRGESAMRALRTASPNAPASPRAARVRRAAIACAVATSLAAAIPAHAGPEMALDVDRLARTVAFDTDIFHPARVGPPLDATVPISGSCVLHPDENCAGGPGIRKLLRFDVMVHNVGDADLILGNPAERPDVYTYSSCHGHYHFKRAATYELLDATGQTVIASGHKQGFCLEDTVPSHPGSGQRRRYDCAYQGISAGFADLYPAFLDCQWIDVTDVPAGDYLLHVVWNPDGLMPEGRLDDNSGTVPISIDPAPEAPPIVSAIRSPQRLMRATAGRPLSIAWTASDDRAIATQEVWFSRDDGRTWRQLVGDLPGAKRSWTWQVPSDAATPVARIRIVARDFSVESGERTSERFSIVAPRGRLARLTR